MNKAISENVRWMRNLAVEFREKEERYMMLILRNQTLNNREITKQYLDGTTHRDDIKEITESLMNKQLIVQVDQEGKKKDSRNIFYTISKQSYSIYFDYSFEDIGTANDIEILASDVVEMYLKQKYFVTIANQKVKNDKLRTDLIAYDYKTNTTTSIEIESYAEVESNPQHVLLNMKKWPELGFKLCHMWSRNKKVQTIYDEQLPDEKKNEVA